MEAFSAKLGLVMDQLNLSRVGLARELAVDKTVVGRWLTGVNRPTGHNLTRLTDIVRQRAPRAVRFGRRGGRSGNAVGGAG